VSCWIWAGISACLYIISLQKCCVATKKTNVTIMIIFIF
jgi:hypothetical protein